MWAWLTSIGPENRLLNKTIQSLPRELNVGRDGTLRVSPVRELETLRGDRVGRENVSLSHPVTGHTAKVPPSDASLLHRIAELKSEAQELRVAISKEQASRKLMGVILFSDGKGGGLPILLRPETGSIRVGDAEAPFAVSDLDPNEDVELRIFVDKYLVEVFVNDRQSLVSAYFGDRGQPGVDAFTVGAATTLKSVETWSLEPTNHGFLEATTSQVWLPSAK
jgi:sucrose-6-phosphate hydrolase SacC (GH32 family)